MNFAQFVPKLKGWLIQILAFKKNVNLRISIFCVESLIKEWVDFF